MHFPLRLEEFQFLVCAIRFSSLIYIKIFKLVWLFCRNGQNIEIFRYELIFKCLQNNILHCNITFTFLREEKVTQLYTIHIESHKLWHLND